ncbi:MAG: nuclear transport factor 2 family protein [Dehalococcoidia bacterium]
MSNVTATPSPTVDTYFAMWNEPDATKRAALIERAWTSDSRYVDPMLEAQGHAALSEMVAGVHARFPGHRFRRQSGIDTHHDQIRFAWDLVAPDGTITVAGVDIGEVAADGRLRRITGFFGEVPAETTG